MADDPSRNLRGDFLSKGEEKAASLNTNIGTSITIGDYIPNPDGKTAYNFQNRGISCSTISDANPDERATSPPIDKSASITQDQKICSNRDLNQASSNCSPSAYAQNVTNLQDPKDAAASKVGEALATDLNDDTVVIDKPTVKVREKHASDSKQSSFSEDSFGEDNGPSIALSNTDCINFSLDSNASSNELSSLHIEGEDSEELCEPNIPKNVELRETMVPKNVESVEIKIPENVEFGETNLPENQNMVSDEPKIPKNMELRETNLLEYVELDGTKFTESLELDEHNLLENAKSDELNLPENAKSDEHNLPENIEFVGTSPDVNGSDEIMFKIEDVRSVGSEVFKDAKAYEDDTFDRVGKHCVEEAFKDAEASEVDSSQSILKEMSMDEPLNQAEKGSKQSSSEDNFLNTRTSKSEGVSESSPISKSRTRLGMGGFPESCSSSNTDHSFFTEADLSETLISLESGDLSQSLISSEESLSQTKDPASNIDEEFQDSSEPQSQSKDPTSNIGQEFQDFSESLLQTKDLSSNIGLEYQDSNDDPQSQTKTILDDASNNDPQQQRKEVLDPASLDDSQTEEIDLSQSQEAQDQADLDGPDSVESIDSAILDYPDSVETIDPATLDDPGSEGTIELDILNDPESVETIDPETFDTPGSVETIAPDTLDSPGLEETITPDTLSGPGSEETIAPDTLSCPGSVETIDHTLDVPESKDTHSLASKDDPEFPNLVLNNEPQKSPDPISNGQEFQNLGSKNSSHVSATMDDVLTDKTNELTTKSDPQAQKSYNPALTSEPQTKKVVDLEKKMNKSESLDSSVDTSQFGDGLGIVPSNTECIPPTDSLDSSFSSISQIEKMEVTTPESSNNTSFEQSTEPDLAKDLECSTTTTSNSDFTSSTTKSSSWDDTSGRPYREPIDEALLANMAQLDAKHAESDLTLTNEEDFANELLNAVGKSSSSVDQLDEVNAAASSTSVVFGSRETQTAKPVGVTKDLRIGPQGSHTTAAVRIDNARTDLQGSRETEPGRPDERTTELQIGSVGSDMNKNLEIGSLGTHSGTRDEMTTDLQNSSIEESSSFEENRLYIDEDKVSSEESNEKLKENTENSQENENHHAVETPTVTALVSDTRKDNLTKEQASSEKPEVIMDQIGSLVSSLESNQLTSKAKAKTMGTEEKLLVTNPSSPLSNACVSKEKSGLSHQDEESSQASDDVAEKSSLGFEEACENPETNSSQDEAEDLTASSQGFSLHDDITDAMDEDPPEEEENLMAASQGFSLHDDVTVNPSEAYQVVSKLHRAKSGSYDSDATIVTKAAVMLKSKTKIHSTNNADGKSGKSKSKDSKTTTDELESSGTKNFKDKTKVLKTNTTDTASTSEDTDGKSGKSSLSKDSTTTDDSGRTPKGSKASKVKARRLSGNRRRSTNALNDEDDSSSEDEDSEQNTGLSKNFEIIHKKGTNRFACSCGFAKEEEFFTTHLVLHHLIYKPFRCSYCKRCLMNKSYMKIHIREKHREEGQRLMQKEWSLVGLKKAERLCETARKFGKCVHNASKTMAEAEAAKYSSLDIDAIRRKHNSEPFPVAPKLFPMAPKPPPERSHSTELPILKFVPRSTRQLSLDVDKSKQMPAEESNQMPADKLNQMSINKSNQISADKSNPMPADESNQMPADKSNQMPAVKSNQMPVDKSNQKPADESMQMPTDESMQMPTDKSNQMPADKSIPIPADESNQMPADESIQMPTDKLNQMPADESNQMSTDELNQMPVEKSNQMPADQIKLMLVEKFKKKSPVKAKEMPPAYHEQCFDFNLVSPKKFKSSVNQILPSEEQRVPVMPRQVPVTTNTASHQHNVSIYQKINQNRPIMPKSTATSSGHPQSVLLDQSGSVPQQLKQNSTVPPGMASAEHLQSVQSGHSGGVPQQLQQNSTMSPTMASAEHIRRSVHSHHSGGILQQLQQNSTIPPGMASAEHIQNVQSGHSGGILQQLNNSTITPGMASAEHLPVVHSGHSGGVPQQLQQNSTMSSGMVSSEQPRDVRSGQSGNYSIMSSGMVSKMVPVISPESLRDVNDYHSSIVHRQQQIVPERPDQIFTASSMNLSQQQQMVPEKHYQRPDQIFTSASTSLTQQQPMIPERPFYRPETLTASSNMGLPIHSATTSANQTINFQQLPQMVPARQNQRSEAFTASNMTSSINSATTSVNPSHLAQLLLQNTNQFGIVPQYGFGHQNTNQPLLSADLRNTQQAANPSGTAQHQMVKQSTVGLWNIQQAAIPTSEQSWTVQQHGNVQQNVQQQLAADPRNTQQAVLTTSMNQSWTIQQHGYGLQNFNQQTELMKQLASTTTSRQSDLQQNREQHQGFGQQNFDQQLQMVKQLASTTSRQSDQQQNTVQHQGYGQQNIHQHPQMVKQLASTTSTRSDQQQNTEQHHGYGQQNIHQHPQMVKQLASTTSTRSDQQQNTDQHHGYGQQNIHQQSQMVKQLASTTSTRSDQQQNTVQHQGYGQQNIHQHPQMVKQLASTTSTRSDQQQNTEQHQGYGQQNVHQQSELMKHLMSTTSTRSDQRPNTEQHQGYGLKNIHQHTQLAVGPSTAATDVTMQSSRNKQLTRELLSNCASKLKNIAQAITTTSETSAQNRSQMNQNVSSLSLATTVNSHMNQNVSSLTVVLTDRNHLNQNVSSLTQKVSSQMNQNESSLSQANGTISQQTTLHDLIQNTVDTAMTSKNPNPDLRSLNILQRLSSEAVTLPTEASPTSDDSRARINALRILTVDTFRFKDEVYQCLQHKKNWKSRENFWWHLWGHLHTYQSVKRFCSFCYDLQSPQPKCIAVDKLLLKIEKGASEVNPKNNQETIDTSVEASGSKDQTDTLVKEEASTLKRLVSNDASTAILIDSDEEPNPPNTSEDCEDSVDVAIERLKAFVVQNKTSEAARAVCTPDIIEKRKTLALKIKSMFLQFEKREAELENRPPKTEEQKNHDRLKILRSIQGKLLQQKNSQSISQHEENARNIAKLRILKEVTKVFGNDRNTSPDDAQEQISCYPRIAVAPSTMIDQEHQDALFTQERISNYPQTDSASLSVNDPEQQDQNILGIPEKIPTASHIALTLSSINPVHAGSCFMLCSLKKTSTASHTFSAPSSLIDPDASVESDVGHSSGNGTPNDAGTVRASSVSSGRTTPNDHGPVRASPVSSGRTTPNDPGPVRASSVSSGRTTPNDPGPVRASPVSSGRTTPNDPGPVRASPVSSGRTTPKEPGPVRASSVSSGRTTPNEPGPVRASSVSSGRTTPNDPGTTKTSSVVSKPSSFGAAQFFSCSLCRFSTLFELKFKKHLEEHEGQDILCIHCGYSTYDLKDFFKHFRSHSKTNLGIATFVCVSCKKFQLNKLAEFMQHLRMYHSKEPVTCYCCESVFSSLDVFQEHLQSSLLTIVKCPHCQAKATDKKSMLQHIANYHPNKGRMISITKHLICDDKKRHGFDTSKMVAFQTEWQNQDDGEEEDVQFIEYIEAPPGFGTSRPEVKKEMESQEDASSSTRRTSNEASNAHLPEITHTNSRILEPQNPENDTSNAGQPEIFHTNRRSEPENQDSSRIESEALAANMPEIVHGKTRIPENQDSARIATEASTANEPDIVHGSFGLTHFQLESSSLRAQESPQDHLGYRCHQCSFVAERTSVLDDHLYKHRNLHQIDDEKDFSCMFCPTTFNDLTEIENHLQHHDEKISFIMYECTLDGFKTNQLHCLKAHIRDDMHQKHSSLNDLIRTSTVMLETKVSKCSKCDFKGIGKGAVIRHGIIHEQSKITQEVLVPQQAPVLDRILIHKAPENISAPEQFEADIKYEVTLEESEPAQEEALVPQFGKSLERIHNKERSIPQPAESHMGKPNSVSPRTKEAEDTESRMVLETPKTTREETLVQQPTKSNKNKSKSVSPRSKKSKAARSKKSSSKSGKKSTHQQPPKTDIVSESYEDIHCVYKVTMGTSADRGTYFDQFDEKVSQLYFSKDHLYHCRVCTKTCKMKRGIHDHLGKHLEIPYLCEICDHEDKLFSLLSSHMKDVHDIDNVRVIFPKNLQKKIEKLLEPQSETSTPERIETQEKEQSRHQKGLSQKTKNQQASEKTPGEENDQFKLKRRFFVQGSKGIRTWTVDAKASKDAAAQKISLENNADEESSNDAVYPEDLGTSDHIEAIVDLPEISPPSRDKNRLKLKRKLSEESLSCHTEDECEELPLSVIKERQKATASSSKKLKIDTNDQLSSKDTRVTKKKKKRKIGDTSKTTKALTKEDSTPSYDFDYSPSTPNRPEDDFAIEKTNNFHLIQELCAKSKKTASRKESEDSTSSEEAIPNDDTDIHAKYQPRTSEESEPSPNDDADINTEQAGAQEDSAIGQESLHHIKEEPSNSSEFSEEPQSHQACTNDAANPDNPPSTSKSSSASNIKKKSVPKPKSPTKQKSPTKSKSRSPRKSNPMTIKFNFKKSNSATKLNVSSKVTKSINLPELSKVTDTSKVIESSKVTTSTKVKASTKLPDPTKVTKPSKVTDISGVTTATKSKPSKSTDPTRTESSVTESLKVTDRTKVTKSSVTDASGVAESSEKTEASKTIVSDAIFLTAFDEDTCSQLMEESDEPEEKMYECDKCTAKFYSLLQKQNHESFLHRSGLKGSPFSKGLKFGMSPRKSPVYSPKKIGIFGQGKTNVGKGSSKSTTDVHTSRPSSEAKATLSESNLSRSKPSTKNSRLKSMSNRPKGKSWDGSHKSSTITKPGQSSSAHGIGNKATSTFTSDQNKSSGKLKKSSSLEPSTSTASTFGQNNKSGKLKQKSSSLEATASTASTSGQLKRKHSSGSSSDLPAKKTQRNKYICSYCEDSFSSLMTLGKHFSLLHTDKEEILWTDLDSGCTFNRTGCHFSVSETCSHPQKFLCYCCNFRAKRRDVVKEHQKEEHGQNNQIVKLSEAGKDFDNTNVETEDEISSILSDTNGIDEIAGLEIWNQVPEPEVGSMLPKTDDTQGMCQEPGSEGIGSVLAPTNENTGLEICQGLGSEVELNQNNNSTSADSVQVDRLTCPKIKAKNIKVLGNVDLLDSVVPENRLSNPRHELKTLKVPESVKLSDTVLKVPVRSSDAKKVGSKLASAGSSDSSVSLSDARSKMTKSSSASTTDATSKPTVSSSVSLSDGRSRSKLNVSSLASASDARSKLNVSSSEARSKLSESLTESSSKQKSVSSSTVSLKSSKSSKEAPSFKVSGKMKFLLSKAIANASKKTVSHISTSGNKASSCVHPNTKTTSKSSGSAMIKSTTPSTLPGSKAACEPLAKSSSESSQLSGNAMVESSNPSTSGSKTVPVVHKPSMSKSSNPSTSSEYSQELAEKTTSETSKSSNISSSGKNSAHLCHSNKNQSANLSKGNPTKSSKSGFSQQKTNSANLSKGNPAKTLKRTNSATVSKDVSASNSSKTGVSQQRSNIAIVSKEIPASNCSKTSISETKNNIENFSEEIPDSNGSKTSVSQTKNNNENFSEEIPASNSSLQTKNNSENLAEDISTENSFQEIINCANMFDENLTSNYKQTDFSPQKHMFYNCPFCSYRIHKLYVYSRHLAKHKRFSKVAKKWKCGSCLKNFTQEKKYSLHKCPATQSVLKTSSSVLAVRFVNLIPVLVLKDVSCNNVI